MHIQSTLRVVYRGQSGKGKWVFPHHDADGLSSMFSVVSVVCVVLVLILFIIRFLQSEKIHVTTTRIVMTQTHGWGRHLIGADLKKERLNDRNKSGLRGQVGLTDVCNKTVWNSLIKSNFTKWYSVTVYRCDLCIRNGCQKLYRGDNVPRDVIELNLESCGAIARCHTE